MSYKYLAYGIFYRIFQVISQVDHGSFNATNQTARCHVLRHEPRLVPQIKPNYGEPKSNCERIDSASSIRL